MEYQCSNSNNLIFKNTDKSIILNLLLLRDFPKVLQIWFNNFTWILWLHLAPSGGVEFSLVEPDLTFRFRSANKIQVKMRDRTGNYDMTIWFQVHWDENVV